MIQTDHYVYVVVFLLIITTLYSFNRAVLEGIGRIIPSDLFLKNGVFSLLFNEFDRF